MSEIDRAFTDDKFIEIVVNTAAEDEYIKDVVHWIIKNQLEDTKAADIFNLKMAKYLIEGYGLNEELSHCAFEVCENNFKRDVLNYGQA